VITDIFNTGTYAIRHADLAAAFGCAVSGAKYLLDISYEEAATKFVEVDSGALMHPLGQDHSSIRKLLQRYETLEKSANTH
jgi:hypothetical protein